MLTVNSVSSRSCSDTALFSVAWTAAVEPVVTRLMLMVMPSDGSGSCVHRLANGRPARASSAASCVRYCGTTRPAKLAVLESRAGMSFAGKDVYLNVAGGLRITEPAADLAVAAALTSALSGLPLPGAMVVFGEIGLSGEIRGVSQTALRLKEASKLGFQQAIKPPGVKGERVGSGSISMREISHLRELLTVLGWESSRQSKPENEAAYS